MDGQLQRALQIEETKAKLSSAIQQVNGKCWTKCITYPAASFSSKEIGCLENCAGRYYDTIQFLTRRQMQVAHRH
ncbi:hypothetical protein SNEBB_002986 [Seison nebaliae]|nr:hypothetical protein SNEBB_002986 [Seison nebaliae]